MAWPRNNYGNQNRSYGGGQNRSYGNNGGYNGGGNGRNFQPKKPRSGAGSGTDKHGKPYVNGWRISKRFGLISYLATPYKNTTEVKSGSGRVWQTWILKQTIVETGEESVKPCLFDPQTRRIFCKDINLMLSPQTRRQNGGKGYAGKFL